jgi:hypothetical protein
MKSIFNLEELSQNNKYEYILSFTRVFASILILYKILLQWNYANLIFGGSSFLVPTNSQINIFFFNFSSYVIRDHIYNYLCIFIFLLILYIFGIGKNFTAFCIFLMYDIYQKLCPQILNGGDNILRFVLLYLTIADSFNFFTFDTYKSNFILKTRNILSNLAGLSISIHLCLVYFISAIHKIHADVWFNGIATYYTLNLERFNGTRFNIPLSNNVFFVVITTYGTIFLELLYPILIWNKKYKLMFILLMLLLHISIAILMMLYDFQLLFIFLQLYFINDNVVASFFEKLWQRVRHYFKQLSFL